jgi:DNA repair protein RecN (Recombination protein N)
VLRELHVRNLAVLAEASVCFGEGLNILSGETGAGKSIIVDSLSLLAGARASSELIRSGADALTVAGVFTPSGGSWRELLGQAGIEIEGDELLIRREIGRNGRNRVLVNDQPTTLRLLADLSPMLLRIHGQRDESELLASALQRTWLDRSGGPAAERLRDVVAEAFDRWSELEERLNHWSAASRSRQERLELLRFQAAEIDAARAQPGEDHALRAERETLRHVETINSALAGALTLLAEDEGSAVERAGRAANLLSDVVQWEPDAAGWGEQLEEARIRLNDVASELSRRVGRLEADPARLDTIENRLALLERLCKRHGGDVAAVLTRRAEMGMELEQLESQAESAADLQEKRDLALGSYEEAALALSRGRTQWGERLSRGIALELKDLGLGRARLSVALERRPRAGSSLVIEGEAIEFGRLGIDSVVFLFAPNAGEEPRPLSRIASGGELSRLSLALQLAAGQGSGESRDAARQADVLPTLVFDEVDTGIGGAEAAALGRKLQRLAQDGQIFAVTHLPQVASHADHHFKVSKSVHEGRTRVSVEALPPRARVEEVARMLAGDSLTALSLSHAEELIAGAHTADGRGASGE